MLEVAPGTATGMPRFVARSVRRRRRDGGEFGAAEGAGGHLGHWATGCDSPMTDP